MLPSTSFRLRLAMPALVSSLTQSAFSAEPVNREVTQSPCRFRFKSRGETGKRSENQRSLVHQQRSPMSGQSEPRIRVVVADDHPMLREGVHVVIEGEDDMEVVGEAATGREAVALYRDLQPDLMLIDIQMPDGDGVDAIRHIRKEFPEARLIVLTTYSGDARALDALRAGASGYLLKNTLRRELLDAMRSVHNGGKHLNAEVASQIAVHISDQALTPREREVLQLAAEGNSNKQIAHRLTLSEDTIKGHMKVIFAKLGASDRTHAVTLAARRGMIAL